jgi:hypothetical protein
MLFEFVENILMRPKRLRQAIESVVHENDHLLRALKDCENNDKPTNLSWQEGGFWKGWNYNEDDGKYYFDDIGNESIMGLWENQTSSSIPKKSWASDFE